MKNNIQSLVDKLDAFSELGGLKKAIPDFISNNLKETIELREYQKEAITRLKYYIEEYKNRNYPAHLLYHMATGSGKTLLMAANILYLYKMKLKCLKKSWKNFKII